MPKYATEIGRLIMKADRPITNEDRTRARKLLAARESEPILVFDDVEVTVEVR